MIFRGGNMFFNNEIEKVVSDETAKEYLLKKIKNEFEKEASKFQEQLDLLGFSLEEQNEIISSTYEEFKRKALVKYEEFLRIEIEKAHRPN